ncbi:UDP-N-acetylmuramoyl-tripeptide--D-alanyl-D-alanine ligase [Actinomycetes bacterium]|nr:UDP-N-acetylmuramoyl-tripeptide--D-alanyl-D-alanine ligase [Actinomycetes bacterium]
MRFMAADVARAVSGELSGANAHLDGVSFDSRSIKPGQLFVPIVDQRDGHDFIADALSRGAGAYLTQREPQGRTAVKVENTIFSLLKLGAWARTRLDQQLQNRVIGVTGSVGKTSTKDFIASALATSLRTHANQDSFNNDFGLPTTILNAPDDVEVLVLEMGMRGFGEISRLCEVAQPKIGIVTAVANAHTERVGSIDGVQKAKQELIESLPDSGVAILNADDSRVLVMRKSTQARILTFGESKSADVRMVSCDVDQKGCATAMVATPWGDVRLSMLVPGRHMVHNALAALCVAGVLELDVNTAAAEISNAHISSSRMQIRTLKNGAVVLDDSYNANPASMRAAIDTLSTMAGSRRIAFCGLMAELAEPSADHLAIASQTKQSGIKLIAVETELYGVAPITFAEARQVLAQLGKGDAVLVKASKVAGLVRLCDGL